MGLSDLFVILNEKTCNFDIWKNGNALYSDYAKLYKFNYINYIIASVSHYLTR